MSDTFEKINIMRARAHESGLPTIEAGHLTLSHELVGKIDKETLKIIFEDERIPYQNVDGFIFFDTLMERIIALIKSGYSVQTDWLHAYISLSGTVPPERLGHHALPGEVAIKANFNMGKKARELVNTLTIEIDDHVSSSAPVIQSVTNPTEKVPNTLNQREMAEIRGLNVMIAGDRPDLIGVFFTPAYGGDTIHVPYSKFSPNTAGHIQFVLPAGITAGFWTVKLVTQTDNHRGKWTQTVREDTYGTQVEVL